LKLGDYLNAENRIRSPRAIRKPRITVSDPIVVGIISPIVEHPVRGHPFENATGACSM